MAKALVIILAVPFALWLVWFARWLGVPSPWDRSLITFIALVILAVERRRLLAKRYGR
jgi:hypothetical protein